MRWAVRYVTKYLIKGSGDEPPAWVLEEAGIRRVSASRKMGALYVRSGESPEVPEVVEDADLGGVERSEGVARAAPAPNRVALARCCQSVHVIVERVSSFGQVCRERVGTIHAPYRVLKQALKRLGPLAGCHVGGFSATLWQHDPLWRRLQAVLPMVE